MDNFYFLICDVDLREPMLARLSTLYPLSSAPYPRASGNSSSSVRPKTGTPVDKLLAWPGDHGGGWPSSVRALTDQAARRPR